MSNKEKYAAVFLNSLLVTEDLLPSLKYQDVDNWDSIGHVSMISELEETFNIMIEMEDILDFNSYLKGFEILKKYGVEF